MAETKKNENSIDKYKNSLVVYKYKVILSSNVRNEVYGVWYVFTCATNRVVKC